MLDKTEDRDGLARARENGAGWLSSIEEMLAAYNAAENDNERDAAETAIFESPLSVMVRDGWRSPGWTDSSQDDPEEYEILLSTGGPALRIWGKLKKLNKPISAVLQMQDWGTPWTRCEAPESTLLEFAGHFYFGG